MKDFGKKLGIVLLAVVFVVAFVITLTPDSSRRDVLAKVGTMKIFNRLNQYDGGPTRIETMGPPRVVHFPDKDYVSYLQYSRYGDETLAPEEYKKAVILMNERFPHSYSVISLYEDGHIRMIVNQEEGVGRLFSKSWASSEEMKKDFLSADLAEKLAKN